VLLKPGTTIGDYTVQAFLGAGGMASVYRVVHTSGSVHALKVLRQTGDAAVRAEKMGRFIAEGEIQARLRHPHLLPVLALIKDPVGLVMELLRGEDLGARLIREGAQPPLLAVGWIQQILSALALVHSHDIVHRDLKPGNIFLERLADGTDQVRVMDFGLARVLGLSQTRTGAIIGSLCYLSPEQITDNLTVDHRADLFTIGALLFELLTGTQAFVAESEFSVMERIRSGSQTPVAAINPDIPDSLCEVVRRALRPDPDDRYPDAAAFSAALQTTIDAGDVPQQVSHRIHNAQEALLRKTVRARLEKSLSKLSRRRGGIAGLPELPPLLRVFTLAGRLEAMSLPALQDAAQSLPDLIGAARQAIQDWEIETGLRIDAFQAARYALRDAQVANQPDAIAAEVGGGLGARWRWRRVAQVRWEAEGAAAQALSRVLTTLPELPETHPLTAPTLRRRQRAEDALVRARHCYPPPPLSMWMAVVLGVLLGLLGTVVWVVL
jgi:serine/threonine protein kinase